MRREEQRSTEEKPEILNSEDARSGSKSGRVLSVLVSSLLLALIVMIFILYRYWSP